MLLASKHARLTSHRLQRYAASCSGCWHKRRAAAFGSALHHACLQAGVGADVCWGWAA